MNRIGSKAQSSLCLCILVLRTVCLVCGTLLQVSEARASAGTAKVAVAVPAEVATATTPWQAQKRATEAKILGRCSPARVPRADGRSQSLEAWISETVTSDMQLRRALVAFMRSNQEATSPCVSVVEARVREVQKGLQRTDRRRISRGDRQIVLLAVAAGLVSGREVLVDLIEYESASDWLLALRGFDVGEHERALGAWVGRQAEDARRELSLPLAEPSRYGDLDGNVLVERGGRALEPLLINAHLSVLLDRNAQKGIAAPSAETWSHLNVLYSLMGPPDRVSAGSLLTKLIKSHEASWIGSIRREPNWVQYRLINLMKGVSGPEVVKELMWLSENHSDLQIRAKAATAFNDVLTIVPSSSPHKHADSFSQDSAHMSER